MWCFIVSAAMRWSCYLWLWLVVTPAISRIALSGFSSHLPGRLTYKYSRFFFSCYEDLHYGTIDEDPWVPVTFLARFAVSVKSFFVSSARPIPKQLSRPHSIASHEKTTSGTQGRSTCAIKTIKDCTSIAIKVCYLCWHCFLIHICREQWIRSCCDQWFGCDF